MAELISNETDAIFRDQVSGLHSSLTSKSSVYAVMPETAIQCPNCVWNSSSNCSAGIYRQGGPKPFTGKMCPVCKGVGKIVTRRRLKLEATARWARPGEKFEDFMLPAGDLNLNTAMIRVFATDRSKVDRADHFVVDGVKCRIVGQPNNRGLKTVLMTEFLVKREE